LLQSSSTVQAVAEYMFDGFSIDGLIE